MKLFTPSVKTQRTRRDLLKLATLLTTAGALPLLAQHRQALAAKTDQPLRIGYLPITDATPLLVAHNNGLFEQQGLNVEKPRLFRSWAQLVEAFLSGQVNAVHLLSPMTVWARYASKAPVKVVAWNHMSGSGLTVAPNIAKTTDLGGTTVAIPFWYSIHNVVLQQILQRAGLEPVIDGTPGPQQVKLVVMAPSDMLPAIVAVDQPIAPLPAALAPSQPEAAAEALVGRPLAEVERMVIEATLKRFDGSVPKAARVLDLAPSTLYRKIAGWKEG